MAKLTWNGKTATVQTNVGNLTYTVTKMKGGERYAVISGSGVKIKSGFAEISQAKYFVTQYCEYMV